MGGNAQGTDRDAMRCAALCCDATAGYMGTGLYPVSSTTSRTETLTATVFDASLTSSARDCCCRPLPPDPGDRRRVSTAGATKRPQGGKGGGERVSRLVSRWTTPQTQAPRPAPRWAPLSIHRRRKTSCITCHMYLAHTRVHVLHRDTIDTF